MVELAAGEPQAVALEQVEVHPHQPYQAESRAVALPLYQVVAAAVVPVVAPVVAPAAVVAAEVVAVAGEAAEAEAAVGDHQLPYLLHRSPRTPTTNSCCDESDCRNRLVERLRSVNALTV